MHLSGCEDIVVGFLLLEHHPHAIDIIAGMTPVAPGIKVADVEPLLQTNRDGCDRTRDLARDERLAAQRALVIEQDTVRGVIAVSLAIVDGDPVGIKLRGPIGAARIKGRVSLCGVSRTWP